MPRPLVTDPERVTFAKGKQADEQKRREFENWICDQLQRALDSRHRFMADNGYYDQWHALYEQAERPRGRKPWPDAADLASYIPTEKVDALRARLVQTVFGPDPICTVEGWGVPSGQVAKIEAFHQWKAEDERLQSWVSKAIHQSLIETNGILEVSERVLLRKQKSAFKAKVKADPYGSPMLDEDGAMQPDSDEAGKFIEWDGNQDSPMLEILRESRDYAGEGPEYAIVSGKDFLYLPAHAADQSKVWGRAKRFWLLPSEIQQRVDAGLFDAKAVEGLGDSGERDQRAEHTRQGITIAAQDGPTAEKEFWQVCLLYDVDGDGIQEYLICVVSLKHQKLIRLAHDNLHTSRFIDFCPFPRHDSVYGYSFVGHKLWTTTEEHTALRNMAADRQAMALNAPIKVLTTAVWEPDDEPWGPLAIIPVRTMQDIEPFQVPDVPSSTLEREQNILGAAERLTGLSDTAMSGVRAPTRRTATETEITAQASFVRVDEAVRYIQEAIEDLYLARHELWKRALQANPTGVQPPYRIADTLSRRGIELPTGGAFAFTAQDLAGSIRFKPRGSTETADKFRLRADFSEFLAQGLPAMMQAFPSLAMQIQSNPMAGQEMLEYALRLWGIPNVQAFFQQMPGMAAPQGVLPMGGAPAELPPLPALLQQGMPGLFAPQGGDQMGSPLMLPPAGGVQ